MQNTFENASVRDFRECNRILENATSSSTRGFYFSADSSWDDAVVTISEASFCQEQEPIDGVTQNFKSQLAQAISLKRCIVCACIEGFFLCWFVQFVSHDLLWGETGNGS